MRWTLLIFAVCCGIAFAQVPKPGSVTVNLSTIPCVSTPPQISAPLGTLCYIGPAIYLCTGAVNVTTCSVSGDWTLQPSSGAIRTGSITVVPLATPAAPSVTSTCVGTCVTTYSYGVVAYLPDGSSTQVGTLTTITSGPTSLASYPNHIVLPGETGATSCALARMSGGGTTGLLTSTIGSLCNANIVDDGLMASGSSPAANTTGLVNGILVNKRVLWSTTFMDSPETDATSGYRAFGVGGATTYFSFELLADWPGALTFNLTGWSATATLAPTISVQHVCISSGSTATKSYAYPQSVTVSPAAGSGRSVATPLALDLTGCAAGSEYFAALSVVGNTTAFNVLRAWITE